ncbi:MAG: hypothetical protein ABI809_04530 [Caldimonas sp.]
MARSSILGGERAPVHPAGHDTDALGPSDSSDSGSDVQGERGFDALDTGEIGGDRADLSSDTDASGTGERGAAVHDADIVEGADIAPDRIGVFNAADDADALNDPEAIDIESLVADSDTESDDDATS